MSQKSILTLTVNPALDKSTRIEQINPDQKLRCQAPRYEPGGGGINVSRAIARLGGQSLAVYTCGGPIGEMFCDLLKAEQIEHQTISIANHTRVSFTALEKSSNQQYRFIMPGPELSEQEWQTCLKTIQERAESPAYVVASGSLPPGVPADFYGQLAQTAKSNGYQLIVDTSGDALRAAAGSGVYLLKPNMRELKHLSGSVIDSEEQQEQAVRLLIEKGQAQVVVVSMGAAGALLATAHGFERIRAPTVNIQSKIGAGDSMVAGIVLALARGKSVPEAVRFGIAAGASAVSTPGTELCRRDETEKLYQQIAQPAQ